MKTHEVEMDKLVSQELRALLDTNPNLEPTTMLDGHKIVTLTIVNGEPHIVESAMPPEFDYDIPNLLDLVGTPIHRLYYILRDKSTFYKTSSALSSASIQAQMPTIVIEEGIQIETPSHPTMPEILNSTIAGNTNLRTQEDQNGMYRNLERMQEQLQQIAVSNPNVSPVIIKTAKETVVVSVVNGEVNIQASVQAGLPFLNVRDTIPGKLLLLTRGIQGLEAKLYGQVAAITVPKSMPKVSASEKLISQLVGIDCGNLAIYIRSRKKTLFLSGSEQSIIYKGRKFAVENDMLIESRASEDPAGYTKIEYGALNLNIQSVLQAFWALLSKTPENSET